MTKVNESIKKSDKLDQSHGVSCPCATDVEGLFSSSRLFLVIASRANGNKMTDTSSSSSCHYPFTSFSIYHKSYNFLDCDWFKKLLFSTNSLAKLLSGQFVVGQYYKLITFKVVV